MRSCFRWKLLLQHEQVKGFSPEWVRLCTIKRRSWNKEKICNVTIQLCDTFKKPHRHTEKGKDVAQTPWSSSTVGSCWGTHWDTAHWLARRSEVFLLTLLRLAEKIIRMEQWYIPTYQGQSNAILTVFFKIKFSVQTEFILWHHWKITFKARIFYFVLITISPKVIAFTLYI